MKGKAALITGSATGIGKAIACRLAQEGVHIAVNYSKSEKEALETKKEIEALGVNCIVIQGTVSDDRKVRDMVQQTIDTFGRLDILVNNAGVTDFVKHDDLEGLKEEYWDRVMDVNVKGMFFCCRAAAAELKKTERLHSEYHFRSRNHRLRQFHRLCGLQSGGDQRDQITGPCDGTRSESE